MHRTTRTNRWVGGGALIGQTAHVADVTRVPTRGALDVRAARSREAMLAAGVRLLGSDGCNAVTHQRVAQEAGVGRATAYRHWSTPHDLLIAVLQRALADDVRTVAHVGTTREDLVAELSALAAAINDGPTHDVIITLIERSASDPALRALHSRLTRRARRGLWSVISAAIERGELDPDLNETTAAAQTIGPLFYRRVLIPARVRPADIESVVDAFLRAYSVR